MVEEYRHTHTHTYTHLHTIHIIKMKPVNVKSRTYIDFHKENDKEDSKFKMQSW